MALLDRCVPGVVQLGRIGWPHVLDAILLARQAEDGLHDQDALLLDPAGRHRGCFGDRDDCAAYFQTPSFLTPLALMMLVSEKPIAIDVWHDSQRPDWVASGTIHRARVIA
jgi:hypothetical protein